VRYQITFDCTDPEAMARFWAEALEYVLEPPPDGHADWRDYWRSVGIPEDELDGGHDSIVDPAGAGPRIWFQRVPEAKTVKNRLHFDVRVGGGRSVPIEERKQRVDAEVDRLSAAGATVIARHHSPDVDHYFVAMRDPEGNEFDVV
jgi:catechol 2,3-dioxygenase-like lactoylglutathione lyase family enzyme